ncbi:hypothetical protein R3W88_003122 [Solanum pinnatisectum]|uniref:Uncharacterized protein n=1 Tax=Solanum pinnatisectum TaxID=50273 RepID=A0AAV9MQV3_9SOLN|nr:hypothetical protein R3W88_003122 [Solanum pinnatisectum]
MDRERRKRKNLENERLEKEEEEDEDEDEKIDKFFALIRSTKDIRDRLFARNQATERSKILEENNNNRDSAHNNSAVGIWNRSIQSRDFMEIDDSAIVGPSNSNSNKQHKEVEEDERGGKLGTKEDSNDEEKKCNMLDLDLNLSL